MKYLLLLFISLNILAIPSLREINEEFNLASEKYNVPAPLLKALAFKQSNWDTNNGKDDELNRGTYGIMGLYQDNKVSSIQYGAKLLNIDPIYGVINYKWNIEISAKIISELRDDYFGKDVNIENIEDYYNILIEYLDYDEAIRPYAEGLAIKIYKLINNGYTVKQGEEIVKVNPYRVDISDIKFLEISEFYKKYTEISSLSQIPFVASPNYSSRSASVDQILIHLMQGSFEGTISWFKNSASKVSSHYLVSRQGELIQMVRLSNKAWHAGTHNSRSIGIEHEGRDDNSHSTYVTEEEYKASAKIVKWLAESYGIPKIHRDAYHDENGNFTPWSLKRPDLARLSGILGHHDCNGKEFCPGPHWNWSHYMELLDGVEDNNPTGGGDNDETLDENCENDETPAKRVRLSAYKIGKKEVTVAQYKKCVEAGSCTAPELGNYVEDGRDNHPINNISWFDAQKFCAWLGGGNSNNVRLPTEAEWEHAAKGDDNFIYPWGEEEPTCDLTVMEGEDGEGCGERSTAEVGSKTTDTSPLGVLDMGGNISEFTNDYYDPSYYGQTDSISNPKGPVRPTSDSTIIVVRGGNWQTHKVESFRNSKRVGITASKKSAGVGFRCAYKEENVENGDNGGGTAGGDNNGGGDDDDDNNGGGDDNGGGNDLGEGETDGGGSGGGTNGRDCTAQNISLIELDTTELPYEHTSSKDTKTAPNDCFDKYPPNTQPEKGKEYIYHFTTTEKVEAEFYIDSAYTNEVDIDLYLFKKLDTQSPDLVARNDGRIVVTLEAGEYYLSLDSYTKNGVDKEGSYHLTIKLKKQDAGTGPITSGDYLNPYILKAANYVNSNYGKKGYGNYNFTHQIYYGNSAVHVSGGSKTQCVGLVQEAIIIALKYYKDERPDSEAFNYFNYTRWKDTISTMYQYGGHGRCWRGASCGITSQIDNFKMGRTFDSQLDGLGLDSTLKKATPGSAIHLDRNFACRTSGGSKRSVGGHSVVFIAFIDKYGTEYTSYPSGKKIVGFKYISANSSTHGVAFKYAILTKYLRKISTGSGKYDNKCTPKITIPELSSFCSSHSCDTYQGGAAIIRLGDYYIPKKWGH